MPFATAMWRCSASTSDVVPAAPTSGSGCQRRKGWFDRRPPDAVKGLDPFFPRVRTIIDVGGQDSKAIALDESGRVVDFAMNDKCAAGTGRFLEVMARRLEIDLETLGEAGLESAGPLPITSLCTVFAESEVVGLLSEGKKVADIVAGVHDAVAARVGALVRRVGLRTPVLFDGGAALNRGLAKALEKNLGVEIVVPAKPQFVVATGAALLARARHAGK